MLKQRGCILVDSGEKFVFFEDTNKPEVRTEAPFFWAFYNAKDEMCEQSKERFDRLDQAINNLTDRLAP